MRALNVIAHDRFLLRQMLLSLVLCVMLLVNLFVPEAFAAGALDVDQVGSITVVCELDSSLAGGVSFKLYRVAELSGSAEYTLCEEFAAYPVKINGLDSAGWRKAAVTLAGYVQSDSIASLKTGETDENGKLQFDGLQLGLYLLTSVPCEVGDKVYMPDPVLVSVPNRDGSDLLVFDVEVIPKYEETEKEKVSVKVIKIWNDAGNKEHRPDKVIVQLLGNGEIVETVELSKENNWRYTWTELDSDMSWQVVESLVPDGYTVTVEREGNAFVIENTYPHETDDPDTPENEDPNLPQTGLNWWPVSMMAISGMVLFVIGWLRHKRGC